MDSFLFLFTTITINYDGYHYHWDARVYLSGCQPGCACTDAVFVNVYLAIKTSVSARLLVFALCDDVDARALQYTCAHAARKS